VEAHRAAVDKLDHHVLVIHADLVVGASRNLVELVEEPANFLPSSG